MIMSVTESQSLGQFFRKYTSKHKQKVMTTSLYQEYTFEEVARHVESFAYFLHHELKLKPGDRLAIMMPNVVQFCIAFWAAQTLGLVTVAINPMYQPDEIQHVMKNSGAKAIVLWDACAKNFSLAAHGLKYQPQVVITKLGDMLNPLRGALVNLILRYFRRAVPFYFIKNRWSFKKALKQYQGQRVKVTPRKQEDVALLQYTGGTTGRSKGVMLSNHNILSNIDQLIEPYRKLGVKKHYKHLLVLPLFHIYGLCISINAIYNGAQTILIANPKDTQQLIHALRFYKPEVLPLLNTLMVNLLNTRNFHHLKFPWLKVTITGGMATHKSVADEWKKVTGCVVNQGYGLSETSPIISVTRFSQKDEFKSSVGFPVSKTQIKVLDLNGHPVAKGQPGELWVKGPQVMLGYWQNKAATEEVLKSGWFATGDVVCVTKDNQIAIVDRIKDMIIVSGFNVYPAEVEMALTSHPDIIEAAVVGEASFKGNEAVKAYLVTSKPLTLAQVRYHCKSIISAYKVPTHIEIVETLPKSNIGKILRRLLKHAA